MLKSHSGPPTKGTNMPVKRKVTLEQIYAKLEKHDRQFEGMTKLFFKVEDSLKAEIAKVLDRVRILEANVEKLTGDFEKLQQEYFALVQSVKRIEKSLEESPYRKRRGTNELSDVLTRLKRIEHHLGLAEVTPGADQ
jgi:chromosome segregation ATPase